MIESNQFATRRQAKEVIALGKKYAKTAHPNPHRNGCPEPSKLWAMAYRDRRCNLADLPVSHVVTCSPCFAQYMLFRRSAFIRKTLQVSGAAVVLLGAFFAVRFVQNRTSPYDKPLLSERTRPHSPASEPQQETSPNTLPLGIEVNLADFSVTRGNDLSGARKSIHLPAKSLRITFLLPVGMEPGDYTVRLLNAKGSVIVNRQVKARVVRGISSFRMDVELRSASSGAEWTLMIRENGLSWRRYAMVVD